MNLRIATVAGLWVFSGCGQPEPPKEPAVDIEAPTASKAQWSVTPTSVRYDQGTQTVFVQADVNVDLNGSPPRAKEAYLGVTLAAADGEEFDLAIQTVFPDQLDQPLMFSAGVEKPIEDVLIGLWDHKVQPCDSERPGCKIYGFLLDGSLASWPPELYADYKRQRILPEKITFHWSGPELETLASKADLIAFLESECSVFGATAETVTESSSEAPVKNATVFFKHPKDEILAKALAERLRAKLPKQQVDVVKAEALPTDFGVQTPGSI